MTSTPNPYATRRQALRATLEKKTAILAAGCTPSRNFMANTYTVRSSSHFLYFVGQHIPGALLFFGPTQSKLFIPRPSPDDALWHGPSPTLAQLSSDLDCAVGYLDQLDSDELKGAMTLSVMDEHTNTQLTQLLGRALPLRAGFVHECDAFLAQAMITLRSVHDSHAISDLRRAADCTVEAHRAAIDAIRPGLKEYEIWAAMQGVLTRKGMGSAYQPIVTVHGEILHAHGHGNTLCDGDLLLIDVGAETENGWAGDVTRTWPVSGHFSTSQKAIYDLVLAAQKAAINMVRPGVRFSDVHLAAARCIASGLKDLGILAGSVDTLVETDAYALFFPHGIGHLLGLDVHDMEDLGDLPGYNPGTRRSSRFGLCYLRLDRVLEPGMVVTIEPGIYQVPSILENARDLIGRDAPINWSILAEFSDVRGIRIEDDILVTKSGHENLTGHLGYDFGD